MNKKNTRRNNVIVELSNRAEGLLCMLKYVAQPHDSTVFKESDILAVIIEGVDQMAKTLNEMGREIIMNETPFAVSEENAEECKIRTDDLYEQHAIADRCFAVVSDVAARLEDIATQDETIIYARSALRLAADALGAHVEFLGNLG